MRDQLHTRIYRLRLRLLRFGALLALVGLALSILADNLDAVGANHLLVAILNGSSDVLLVTGAIGVAVDLFTGRAKDEVDTERIRAVLTSLPPEFTDTVLESLAASKDDSERVASPELLDGIATNVLSLRMGDDQFAREICADVRDQASKAPKRCYDVDVNQPTRGLSMKVDYTNATIAEMSVADLVTSATPLSVAELPSGADAKVSSLDLPGWLLLRGFAFVWTLVSEMPAQDALEQPDLGQDTA